MLGLEIIIWLRIKTLVPAQVTGLIIEEGCFWIQAGAKLVAALGWLVAEAEAEVGVFFAQLVVVFWL